MQRASRHVPFLNTIRNASTMAQLTSTRATGAPAVAGAKRVAPRVAFKAMNVAKRSGAAAPAGAAIPARSAVVGQVSSPGAARGILPAHWRAGLTKCIYMCTRVLLGPESWL